MPFDVSPDLSCWSSRALDERLRDVRQKAAQLFEQPRLRRFAEAVMTTLRAAAEGVAVITHLEGALLRPALSLEQRERVCVVASAYYAWAIQVLARIEIVAGLGAASLQRGSLVEILLPMRSPEQLRRALLTSVSRATAAEGLGSEIEGALADLVRSTDLISACLMAARHRWVPLRADLSALRQSSDVLQNYWN